MSFLNDEELAAVGFAACGRDAKISRHARFYGAERITIGDDVRIDDFCVVSAGPGGIDIGSHVHLAVYVSVIGAAKITLSDFVGLSSRVSIYSSNDDYSGAALTGPTIPDRFRKIDSRPVWIGRHVVVGSGSVVLPGVTIHDGSAVGALSLVRKDCAPFGLYAGNPLRRIRDRGQGLLELERQLAESRRDEP